MTWDLFILSVTSDGEYLWHSFYGSPVIEDPFSVPDKAHTSVTDETGNIYVVGNSWRPWDGPAAQAPINEHNGGEFEDILILKLNDPGVQ